MMPFCKSILTQEVAQTSSPSKKSIKSWPFLSLPTVKPGGSCANTIKGLGRLGLNVAYHLRDGIDEYGKMYETNLKENNVTVLKVEDELLPSGRLACLITPDKNRSFFSSPGAGNAFCPADLNSLYFKEAKLVHLDGYSLRNSGLVEEAMKLAKAHGARISFDPGCFQLIREHKELILRLLEEYIDIFFANEDEIQELLNMPPDEGCKTLSRLVPIAVVLQGNRGCLVGSNEKVLSVPVRTVSVVDTTGAGDLFASGFLYGLLQGYSLAKCAQIGNLLGSSVIQHVGAEIPASNWPSILEYIEYCQ